MKTVLVGALLVLVGIAIGYFIGFDNLTPSGKSEPKETTEIKEETTPEETRNNNAYNHSTYNFSFDYDTSAFVAHEPDEDTLATTLFTQKDWDTFEGQASGREAPPAVTVEIFENTNNVSAIEWVENETRSNFGFGDGTYEGIKVDGELGVLYSWDGLYRGESAVVAHKGNIYMLSVTFLERSDPLVSEFSSILSSFRFKD